MTAKSPSLLLQAKKTLLTPFGLEVTDLTGVIGRIMRHQVDYADLYFQYSRSEAWSLEEGIVKSGSFSIDEGVGVRALSGEKTAFAYSDDISLPALADAASAVRSIAAAGQSRRVREHSRSARPRTRCMCRTTRWPRSMPRPRCACWSVSSLLPAPRIRA